MLLRFTHYGDLQRYGSPAVVPATGPYAGQNQISYDIGSVWLTDISFDFRFDEHWSVQATVTNLFDRKPDKLPAPLVGTNQYYAYATNGPLSGDGGFSSLSARYQW